MENLNAITSAVYEALFDKTQAELIAEAKGTCPTDFYNAWIGLYNDDEDEAMRDCLSVEALSVLNRIEGDMATYIHQVSTIEGVTLDSLLAGLHAFIQDGAKLIRIEHPNRTIPLWHDDTL